MISFNIEIYMRNLKINLKLVSGFHHFSDFSRTIGAIYWTRYQKLEEQSSKKKATNIAF